MCDCWVGILNDYDQSDTNHLRLSTINSQLCEKAKHTEAMAAQSPQFFIAFKPADYIDRRRGLATLFQFCPFCGANVKWDKIRKGLTPPA